jgi:hypothetical protein
LDEVTFHLPLIESIRVRRAYPFWVVEQIFERERERGEVEEEKRGSY